MKRSCRYFLLPALLLFSFQIGSAQSLIDFNLGFGTMHDKAATTGIDQNTYGSCNLNAPNCSPTSDMSGFAMGIGVNLMLWKHYGFGMNASFQPTKQNYAQLPANPLYGLPPATIQSRVTFYDFNGILQPVTSKKAALQLIGGIGGVNTKFYQNYISGGSPLGSSSYSQYASSANHFQVHGGAGVFFDPVGNFFVRPQFDIHYAPNLTEQFGSNAAWQAMIWVGYTFGDRQ